MKVTKEVGIQRYRRNFFKVPGWLPLIDFELFVILDEIQVEHQYAGDILEIGTYKGKSGILLSWFPGESEMTYLVDLFEEIKKETVIDAPEYSSLDLEGATKNLTKYGNTFQLIPGNSIQLLSIVPHSKYRLIHIDGSHQYEVVAQDLMNTLQLLNTSGVIVLDDYSNSDYPGVASAFWECFANHKLEVICATKTRIYLTWAENAEVYRSKLCHQSIVRTKTQLNVAYPEFDFLTYNRRMQFVQKLYSLYSRILLGARRFF
jgi:hypothetical protein